MSPTQNSIVLLTILSGTERIQQNAIVLSSSPGAEGQPSILNLAFLHPRRLEALGTPDWRNAFDRRVGVKHESHDDVQNSAEGCFWNEADVVNTFAAAEIEKLTTFLLDNHGRECNADTAVDIAIRLLEKSADTATDTKQPDPNTTGEGEPGTNLQAGNPSADDLDKQANDDTARQATSGDASASATSAT